MGARRDGHPLARHGAAGLARRGHRDSARAKDLAITVTPTGDGGVWRLHAAIPDASFDITVTRPAHHDCLAVVVPWSTRRFQYTVKDVALPASGTITTEGVRLSLIHISEPTRPY